MDPGEVLTRAAALPDAVVRYAARPDALVDLHLPRGAGPSPLVVLLHGGFWKQAYDRVHLRPMARALVDSGCVVATPEYRRVGGGGGWPTTLEDVDAAVTALPGLLQGLGVITTTATLAGHSAGGHLALWLAARERPSVGFDRVVALAPVADLRAAATDRLGGGATQALLGGGPDDVPERYAAADPMTLFDGSRTPCTVILVHGTADDDVPITQSRALATAHPVIELRELAGVGHHALVDPRSAAWPAVLDALTGEQQP